MKGSITILLCISPMVSAFLSSRESARLNQNLDGARQQHRREIRKRVSTPASTLHAIFNAHKPIISSHQRDLSLLWMASVSDSSEKLDSTNVTSSTATNSKRKSAFPSSTYSLAVDEERLKYNFVSFIDYTLEPYSQVTRLVEPRFYARSDQFDRNMMDVQPTIEDLAPPPSLYNSYGEFLAWNKLPARAVVGTMAYFIFPWIVQLLQAIITDDESAEALLSMVNTSLPGVSIVLGTYFSLTLSILYDRFSRLQETVALEASLLALTFQNLLDLFAQDDEAAVEGAQCIADQIRTLVRESRGRELMSVIYSDPYSRILQLVQERNQSGNLDSVR